MADYLVTDAELTAVADAIREKGGTSDPLSWPDGYADAIAAIPSGGTLDLGYLTFEGNVRFSMRTKYGNAEGWTGRIEYSTDTANWTVWDGGSIYSSNDNKIYMRGFHNTFLTKGGASGGGTSACWEINEVTQLSGLKAKVSGNILNLLDCRSVAYDDPPPLGKSAFEGLFYRCYKLDDASELILPSTGLTYSCFTSMFHECTSLTKIPRLSATTLADLCYQNMFYGCTSLVTLPQLPAETLKQQCYYQMFYNCSALKLSATEDETYQYDFRIPTSGTGVTASNALERMFYGTGGSFTGTPEINTTYYTDHEPVAAGE